MFTPRMMIYFLVFSFLYVYHLMGSLIYHFSYIDSTLWILFLQLINPTKKMGVRQK